MRNHLQRQRWPNGDWTRSFGIYLHRRRLEVLREFLSREPFSTVLDVGCGDGLLVSVGMPWAIGIDINSGKNVTAIASAEHLPFRSSCFNLLVAGEVIEHLDHGFGALEDWIRVLRPGGTIILSTPNGLLVKPHWNPEHKKTYSPRHLQVTLKRLGLRVVAAEGIFTGLVSGRRVFQWILFDWMKMLLLRLPIPVSLSYDVFIKAKKAQLSN